MDSAHGSLRIGTNPTLAESTERNHTGSVFERLSRSVDLLVGEADVTLRQSWLNTCSAQREGEEGWIRTVRAFERDIATVMIGLQKKLLDSVTLAQATFTDKEAYTGGYTLFTREATEGLNVRSPKNAHNSISSQDSQTISYFSPRHRYEDQREESWSTSNGSADVMRVVKEKDKEIEKLLVQKSNWELRKKNLEDEIAQLNRQVYDLKRRVPEQSPSSSNQRIQNDIDEVISQDERSKKEIQKLKDELEKMKDVIRSQENKLQEKEQSRVLSPFESMRDVQHETANILKLTEAMTSDLEDYVSSSLMGEFSRNAPLRGNITQPQIIQLKNNTRLIREQLEEAMKTLTSPSVLRTQDLKQRIEMALRYLSISPLEEISSSLSSVDPTLKSYLSPETRAKALIKSLRDFVTRMKGITQLSPNPPKSRSVETTSTNQVSTPAWSPSSSGTTSKFPSVQYFEDLLTPNTTMATAAGDSIISLSRGLVYSQSLKEVLMSFSQEIQRKSFDLRSPKVLAIVFGMFHINARTRFLSGIFQTPDETTAATSLATPRGTSPSLIRELGIYQSLQEPQTSRTRNTRTSPSIISVNSPTSPKIQSPGTNGAVSPRVKAYLDYQEMQMRPTSPRYMNVRPMYSDSSSGRAFTRTMSENPRYSQGNTETHTSDQFSSASDTMSQSSRGSGSIHWRSGKS